MATIKGVEQQEVYEHLELVKSLLYDLIARRQSVVEDSKIKDAISSLNILQYGLNKQ